MNFYSFTLVLSDSGAKHNSSFVLSNSGAKLNSCVQCGSNKLPLLLLLRRHPPGSLAPEIVYSLFVNIVCCLKYQYDGSVKIFTLKIWTEQLRESFYIWKYEQDGSARIFTLKFWKRMLLWKYLYWKFEKDGSVSSLRNTCLPLHHRPGDPAVGGWVTLTLTESSENSMNFGATQSLSHADLP